MSLFFLALLLPAPQPAQPDVPQLKEQLRKAYEDFVPLARKLNGSITINDLDGDKKKLNRKISVKADTKRYLVHEVNGDNRFVSAFVYRPWGDIIQGLNINYNARSRAPEIATERYRRPGEEIPKFPIESVRNFAFDAPATLPLRPIPAWKWTFLDLLECPAFKITSYETSKKDNVTLIKITFEVDKAINDKQAGDTKIPGIEKGTITLRPDLFWTVHSSAIMMQTERRKPAREWSADFVYATPAGATPILKEVRVAAAAGKDPNDQKPVKQLYEIDFKPVDGALPDEQFSLKQFNMEERTAEPWLKAEAERLKQEAELNAKIAQIPPEKLKPVSVGLTISPWTLLISGVGAFILLILFVFWVTAKRSPRPNPGAGDPMPTA